jgi:hypothetical protein
MRTLWIQFGNTAAAAARFAVPKLDYPLSFNLPPVAWKLEPASLTVPAPAASGELHLDLVAELARELAPDGPNPDFSWISGYRLCLGIFDASFLRWAPTPSVRDRGVCDYYARWNEGANAVGPLWDLPWKKAKGAQLSLDLQGSNQLVPADPDLHPLQMLEFFRPFNRLIPGDLLSLGTFLIRAVPEAAGEAQMGLGTYSWRLPLERAD